jgi:hypothetical protein
VRFSSPAAAVVDVRLRAPEHAPYRGEVLLEVLDEEDLVRAERGLLLRFFETELLSGERVLWSIPLVPGSYRIRANATLQFRDQTTGESGEAISLTGETEVEVKRGESFNCVVDLH